MRRLLCGRHQSDGRLVAGGEAAERKRARMGHREKPHPGSSGLVPSCDVQGPGFQVSAAQATATDEQTIAGDGGGRPGLVTRAMQGGIEGRKATCRGQRDGFAAQALGSLLRMPMAKMGGREFREAVVGWLLRLAQDGDGGWGMTLHRGCVARLDAHCKSGTRDDHRQGLAEGRGGTATSKVETRPSRSCQSPLGRSFGQTRVVSSPVLYRCLLMQTESCFSRQAG